MKSDKQQSAGGLSLKFGFLRHLRLWQKFVLLAVVAVPAVAVPTYNFYASTQQDIDFARTEQRGLEPSLSLLNLIQATQQHRGLSAGVLSGNEALAGARADKEVENKQLIATMDEFMADITDQQAVDGWNDARNVFSGIARDVNSGAASVDGSFDRHTELISDYIDVLDHVIDYYNLSLDPDHHTYHLIQAALVGLPALTEPFGQLRGLGTGLLAAAKQQSGPQSDSRTLDATLRARLSTLADSGDRNLEFVTHNIQKAMRESAELERSDLGAALKTVEDETAEMVSLVRDELVSPATLTYDSTEYFNRLTQGIDQQLALSDTVTSVLTEQLDAKVAELRNRQLVQSGITALVILVTVVLGFAVVRSILSPVSHLRAVMQGLQEGEINLRARLDSTDEIGEMARQFDAMVDEREAVAARIKEENDTLNESIIEILRPVARSAQGDLTSTAPVREDVTGALSDAINSMTESTAMTLAKVTVAAREVRTASQTGRDTVLQTSQGMNDIRGTIQETGKRIKRLGEQSQEITGIVKLIDDIAERTSVLALNANMQAAMAGEAGRGFRVVADEVQSLAERSKQATDQIGKLVDAIQAETTDTMSTMDRAIDEVVKGGEFADAAAEQVTHLDELGEELLEAIGAFKLPEEIVNESGGGKGSDRRAA